MSTAIGALGVVVAIAAAGCHARHVDAPIGTPSAGISISIFKYGPTTTTATELGSEYGIVDDRRWIEVRAGEPLVLDHIDPSASLSSLLIESADDPTALHVGSCTRDTLAHDAPPGREPHDAALPPVTSSLRCAITGRTGRQLIRILYESPALKYRADHEVTISSPARATLSSRFVIDTPRWQQRASVALYEGAPGGERSPIELARGDVLLDGSVAVIASSERAVGATLRRIYTGAVSSSDATPADALWHQQSTTDVWVTLELATPALALGDVHVHVALPGEAPRDVVVTPDPRDTRDRNVADTARVRLPLWVDDQLHGTRTRVTAFDSRGEEDGSLVERFTFAIANTGDTRRDVVIEEQVRPATSRGVHGAYPSKPELHGDRLANHIVVAAAGVERVGYVVVYK